jgi:hypothetical protein
MGSFVNDNINTIVANILALTLESNNTRFLFFMYRGVLVHFDVLGQSQIGSAVLIL